MKKFLRVVLLLIVVLMPFVSVDAKAKKTTTEAKEKVNFYLFYGDGCPHCEELMENLKDYEKDASVKGLFNLVKLEVWNDTTNSELMKKVASSLGIEASGVPFYVIGSKPFTGYAKSMDSEIKQAIIDAYNNKDKDIVAAINNGEVVTPDGVEENDSSIVVAIVAISITVLIVLLIIFGRTSSSATYYVDEEETTVVEEEKPVVEKEVVKKTTAKKATTSKKTTTAKKTTSAKKTATKSTAKKTTKSNK